MNPPVRFMGRNTGNAIPAISLGFLFVKMQKSCLNTEQIKTEPFKYRTFYNRVWSLSSFIVNFKEIVRLSIGTPCPSRSHLHVRASVKCADSHENTTVAGRRGGGRWSGRARGVYAINVCNAFENDGRAFGCVCALAIGR